MPFYVAVLSTHSRLVSLFPNAVKIQRVWLYYRQRMHKVIVYNQYTLAFYMDENKTETLHSHTTLLKHSIIYNETCRSIGLRSFAILTQETHITQGKVVHQARPIHLQTNHHPKETVFIMI